MGMVAKRGGTENRVMNAKRLNSDHQKVPTVIAISSPYLIQISHAFTTELRNGKALTLSTFDD
jgi:hypothetical protein